MIEKEKSFLSIPRRLRRKVQEETSGKGKDSEVKIVEPPPTSKEVDEIFERVQKEIYEEPQERDLHFENVEIGATLSHSFSKYTKEEERELHLKKIKELREELEDS